MTSAVKYREYARECLKWAAAETDEVKRQALIDTANMWTHAALKMEGLAPAEPTDMPSFIIGATHDGVGSDGGT
jgi:hypothetical protein